jgi:hypothetical protein
LDVPTDDKYDEDIGHGGTTTTTTTDYYTFDVQQDGFLRPYDTAAVMWPTAYLLSLCLGAPRRCGIANELEKALQFYCSHNQHHHHGTQGTNTITHPYDNYPLVIELGAGLGLPSIVLSTWLNQYNLTGSTMKSAEAAASTSSTSSLLSPVAVVTDKSPAALALVQDSK